MNGRKKFLFILISFFVLPGIFSQAVDWTGKSFGKEPSPQWLIDFVQKKNDSALRKHFELKKGDVIYFGYGEKNSEEFSKIQAEFDALSKIKNLICEKIGFDKNASDAVTIFGTELLYVYWEEDENGKIKTYILYSVSKKNFECLLDFNRKKLKL